MADDATTQPPELVPFVVHGCRLYVPQLGAIVRLIPNTPAAIASAQHSLRRSQAAWLN